MKKILFYLFVLLVFNACSTSTEKVVKEKNVIHLAEAIANPVKMNTHVKNDYVFIDFDGSHVFPDFLVSTNSDYFNAHVSSP